jgi:amidase
MVTAREECKVVARSPAPPGLLEAFWRYDDALLSNEQETLNALFMSGPDTVRGDGINFLVGHEQIVGFRAARSRIPTRRVVELQIRVITDEAVLVMARTRDGEATGLQTQLWRATGGRWLVAAAHVSLPARPNTAPSGPFDTSVWRVVGDPLVPSSAPGPLNGLGIAVKDLLAVAGHPIGGGVPAWLAEQHPQPSSAPALTALLEAGAHIVGIARTDEFAYSLAGANPHYGTPPNPAAPDCISGGSTSGPSSAVALSQAAVGLGTDTAGSIRVPASYQGLVGLRTTHGAVSTEAMLPLAPTFDTVGWVTRDVATSVAVAEVLMGGRTREDAPHVLSRTLRLPTVESLAQLDIREAFATTLERLSTAGRLPPVEEVDLPAELLDRWFSAFRAVQAWEAWQAHGAWVSAHPDALGLDVATRFAQASHVSDGDASAAREVVADARARLTELLVGAVLALPSTSGPAPRRNATGQQIEVERAATLRMTCLAGLAGAPAVSLPLLRSTDSRPVGFCLLGAPGTDRSLLDLATPLEASA